jgi:hypothetical protein
MTIIQKAPEGAVAVPAVPEVLTEEHHEALRASWALPEYEREASPSQGRPKRSSHRSLLVGVLAGAAGLGIGLAAGYLVGEQAAQQEAAPVAPVVIDRVVGPVDANGLNLGRRVASFDAMSPTALPVDLGGVDANGVDLGRRIAPIE